MTTLSKYYNIAALLPVAVTTITGIILALAHDGSKYKSEWSTDDGFVFTAILTIALSVVIAFLSLTIFLNKYPAIQASVYISLLSWIALPATLCLFVIYQELLNFTGKSNINGVYHGSRLLDSYILSVAIIHLLGLIVSYFHFTLVGQKKNTAANNSFMQ